MDYSSSQFLFACLAHWNYMIINNKKDYKKRFFYFIFDYSDNFDFNWMNLKRWEKKELNEWWWKKKIFLALSRGSHESKELRALIWPFFQEPQKKKGNLIHHNKALVLKLLSLRLSR